MAELNQKQKDFMKKLYEKATAAGRPDMTMGFEMFDPNDREMQQTADSLQQMNFIETSRPGNAILRPDGARYVEEQLKPMSAR